jgi:uncharacterized LabA/DUF88 family protein
MQENVKISQTVAVLVDGNNLERSLHTLTGHEGAMVNFDNVIPRLLANRALNRLIYFREGKQISSKLAERLHERYHGSVQACHKSADIPLTIKATQLSSKVDTVIIMSGDSDYMELVMHLKSEGVRVEIAAVEKNTAQVLRDEADYFHSIGRDDCFFYTAPKGGHRESGHAAPRNGGQSGSRDGGHSSGNRSGAPQARRKSRV